MRNLTLALAALLLTACAKTGDLSRPAPIFGERAKAEYEAQQRAAAAPPPRAPAAQ